MENKDKTNVYNTQPKNSHCSNVIAKNVDARQFISSKFIANNGDVPTKNNSSTFSEAIAEEKCKKHKKRKRSLSNNKDTSTSTTPDLTYFTQV